MDKFPSSFLNFLNSPLSPNNNPASQENTSSPNFSQNPNFSQLPNFSQYRNSSFYQDHPPQPNFTPNPTFSHSWGNVPNQPYYPPFPQVTQNQKVRGGRQQAPTQVTTDDGAADTATRRKWSVDDDKRLVSAYLTMSNDSVVGNNQKGDAFCVRVRDYYNRHSPEEQDRTLKQCKNRYHTVNKAVMLFAGIHNTQSAKRQSGASDDQITAETRGIYHDEHGHPFKFEHIWRMLRSEPKWKSNPGFESSYQSKKKTRINEAGDYSSSDQPQTPISLADSSNEQASQWGDPSPDDPPSVERRPMGQKTAKGKGKGKGKVGQSSEPPPHLAGIADSQREVAESNMKLARQMQEFTEEIRDAKKERALIKLYKLRSKDTSKMNPEALVAHLELIEFFKNKYGLD